MSSDLSKLLKKILPGVLISLVGLTYFYYFPVHYDFDGTVFSQALRYALLKDDLIHTIQPHHLFYFPINFYSYKFLKTATGYNVLEYFHLQLFSLFFGLMTLIFSYKIIKKTVEHIYFHYIGIILIAFSFGFWYYSVEAEVHIAGLFFVAAGFYYTFFKHDKPLEFRQILLAALCFSLAAGFHLTNGLIAISVLLIFIIEKRSVGKILQFLSCYILFFLLQISVYFIIKKINIIEHFQSQLFGKEYLTGYGHSYWSNLSLGTLWDSLRTTADGILFPSTKAAAIISIIFFFFALAIIFASWIRSKVKREYYRFFAWLFPYFLFFTFWDPKKIEFKLNVILPFLILFLLALSGMFRTRVRIVLSITAVISAALLNLYFVISPAHDIRNNHNYLVVKAIEKVTPPESIIVIAGVGSDISIQSKIYLPYFARRKPFILDWALGQGKSLEDIRAQIKQERARGAPILLFSETTYLSKATEKLLKNHHIKQEDYFRFLERINMGEKIPLIEGYYLKRILPGK